MLYTCKERKQNEITLEIWVWNWEWVVKERTIF